MNSDKTFDQLIDERRRAWNPQVDPDLSPVPAAEVGRLFDAPPLDFLEDTMPLPPYRPERL